MKKRIIRVFPRKTNASPTDDMAFFTEPPLLLPLEADEVWVSVAFTYDIPRAEQLAEAWRMLGVPVTMGGPAMNEPGGNFTPGLFLREGFTISSRGCPNRCWFCGVPQREGYQLRELPVTSGWNLLDDNFLACSEKHIRAVFDMLKKQPKRPIFSGGLEARLLKQWHVELLREAKTQRMYFAYDTPDDYEPLAEAGKLLATNGFSRASGKPRCYVLIGYHGDTFEAAENRLYQAWEAGFRPFAMLYHDESGQVNADWRRFQREWTRPEILMTKLSKG